MHAPASQQLLDSEEAKNVAVVHKTNQGYSGKDLWKLKQERPELFCVPAAATGSGAVSAPAGYQEDPRLGADWLYNRERDIYLHRETKKHYVRDPATNDLCELGRGRDLTPSLAIQGDAAACAESKGATSKHVVINDLHRAASSMKLDFAHHDSPAAMFAVYDGSAGGTVAESAAKGLHVRLLPRLAQHRGNWENERLEQAVAESVSQLASEIGVAKLSLAIALVLGGRVTLAASGGAMCCLFGKDGGADGGMDDIDIAGLGDDVTTHCGVLEDSHLGVLLSVDGVRKAPGLGPTRLRALVRGHVMSERPRAACITVLSEARRAGAVSPLACAAVRFGWSSSSSDATPAAKRARTEASRLTKVRCRHIMLRHSGCTSQIDRGKAKATRTALEAEEQLMRLLPELSMLGATAFTTRCKEVSECDTNLRGGDLAGDLGWLDKDPAKNRKVPAAVTRAAFTMSVGQLSDIVSSDRGMHLLLRTG